MSALQTFSAKDPDQSLEKLKRQLSALSKKSVVVLQWIPAHPGIRINEKAAELVKEGSRIDQPLTRLSFREVRTLIKHQSGYKPHQDPLHLLTRAEQTIIFCLRTGHCCLKAHLQ